MVGEEARRLRGPCSGWAKEGRGQHGRMRRGRRRPPQALEFVNPNTHGGAMASGEGEEGEDGRGRGRWRAAQRGRRGRRRRDARREKAAGEQRCEEVSGQPVRC